MHQLDSLSRFTQDTFEENQNSLTAPYGDDSHKNKKPIIVKSIHSSFLSESKMYIETEIKVGY